jgi:hypothetical protein
MPPNGVAKSATAKNRAAVCRYLLAFGRYYCHFHLCGRLLAYGSHQHVPHILLRQSRPPPIIWAPAGGLRSCTAWSYCTPCIYHDINIHINTDFFFITLRDCLTKIDVPTGDIVEQALVGDMLH